MTVRYPKLISSDMSLDISYSNDEIDLKTLNSPENAFSNLGMTINVPSSTITIHSGNGDPLSATNFARLVFPSRNSPGTVVSCILTSNVTMDFSDMDGNTMGTVAATAWTDLMPLYLYAVLNNTEDACTFGWARVPHHARTPVAADIGNPSTSTADAYTSFFLFEDVTIADYEEEPVVAVGGAKASKNASDEWTFDSINFGEDGVNFFNENVSFDMPLGQNGAIAGFHYWSANGNIPQAVTNVAYNVMKDGLMTLDTGSFNLDVAGSGTSGSDILFLMSPLRPGTSLSGLQSTRGGSTFVAGNSVNTGKIIYRGVVIFIAQSNGHYGIEFQNPNAVGAKTGDFTITGQNFFAGSMTFNAFANLG